MTFINEINDILWTYILIIMLLGCAVWFSIRTRFVQFRMIREMIVLLSESAGKGKQGEKHVSSFQAFAITIASRVGTGKSCGGGHCHCHRRTGGCFLDVGDRPAGSFECFHRVYFGTIIQNTRKGFVHRRTGLLYEERVEATVDGYAFRCAHQHYFRVCFQFGTEQYDLCCCGACVRSQSYYIGRGTDITDIVIIFGGIQRIARVSSIIVPVMALGYVGLALVIVALNITHLPGVIALIVSHAFGWEQALAGGVGMALMQGIKRGLLQQ